VVLKEMAYFGPTIIAALVAGDIVANEDGLVVEFGEEFVAQRSRQTTRFTTEHPLERPRWRLGERRFMRATLSARPRSSVDRAAVLCGEVVGGRVVERGLCAPVAVDYATHSAGSPRSF
jgi:hypothetical protein